MKVYLKHITEEGLPVSGELSPAFIGLTEDDYLHFITPVSIEALIQRFDEIVIGNFTVCGRFQSVCARSLEKIERDWTEKFQLEFPVTDETEFIELDEDIRQEIIIRVPLRVLSDAEAKKEAMEIQEQKKQAKNDKNKNKANWAGPTYKPFENLKDLDNT